MSDKLRPTFPVPVTFNDGELPTASKLNGLERQSRQGQGIISRAIGDIWNSSGDSQLSSNDVDDTALMHPSLARVLGPLRMLNTLYPYLPYLEKYTHVFTDDAGEYAAQMPIGVNTSGTFTWAGTGTPSSKKSSSRLVAASGDWFISSGGWFICYDEIQSDWRLTYDTNVDNGYEYDNYKLPSIGSGSTETWNESSVIPDPDTHSGYAFQGIKIQYVNGTDNSEGYYIFLPPRMPLTNRTGRYAVQYSNWSPANSYNEQTNPSSGDRLYWQDDGVACPDTGTNARHYRYALPSYIVNNWSQAATIPAGTLYLWDYSQTKTIIEGVTFAAENAANPRVFLLVASGAAFDNWISNYGETLGYTTARLQSTTHLPADYPSGLRLVCAGFDVSSWIYRIYDILLKHNHLGTRLESFVPHYYLRDTFDPEDTMTAATSSSIHWTKPFQTGDDHPQYLHRAGSNAGSSRDNYLNAMLGDLCLASSNSASYFQNFNDNSRQIVFSSYSSGPTIYYDSSLEMLRVGNRGFPITNDSSIRDYPTSDATYGYSAASAPDGYGPVRSYWVSPQEVSAWQTFNTTEGQTPALFYNVTLPYDYGTGFQTTGLRIQAPTGGTNYRTYAFAYLPFTFAKYCIVDVTFSCYPQVGSWAGLDYAYHCAVGYSSGASASGNPNGTVSELVYLYDVFNAMSASSYPVPQYVMSHNLTPTEKTQSAICEIDNEVSVPLFSGSRPYIRFGINGAFTSSNLFIKDIIVLYRVKEY